MQNETLKDSCSGKIKAVPTVVVIIGIKTIPCFGNSFMNKFLYETGLFCWRRTSIIEEHYEILEKIIALGKAGEIEIRYNSNGVEWRDDLFDLEAFASALITV